jgi:hypothetical protein
MPPVDDSSTGGIRVLTVKGCRIPELIPVDMLVDYAFLM